MTMRFGSLCSGIDAASVAWSPLGWKAQFFSEIDRFASAVLACRWPEVPNLGDMMASAQWGDHAVDVVIGGTPCQDNSVGYSAGAGRAGDGLDGTRSGLAWGFVSVVDRYRPRWFVWENVPNLLNARLASGFLGFARRLADLGYHLVWRVLDGAGFGLADQPRPRIIMVGHHRDPRAAAAVLLEPAGPRRDRRPETDAAPVLTARGGHGFRRSHAVRSGGRPGPHSDAARMGARDGLSR